MSYILCIGNNSEDTDRITRELSASNGAQCHGLITGDFPWLINQHGYYHTSVFDLHPKHIKKIAARFDKIIMLDQLSESYSHPNGFLDTVQLIKELPNGSFQNPKISESLDYWNNLVNTNKSFCIFPFIELVTERGNCIACCRSTETIVEYQQLDNFYSNKQYRRLRKAMLEGTELPDYCNSCYEVEKRGSISARQAETVEWANRLQLKSIDDLTDITHPVYYEVRPSNHCNLKCRMCTPGNSHLVEREYKRLNLIPKNSNYSKYQSDFDIVNLDYAQKVYVAGGEPMLDIKLNQFFKQCIEQKRQDLEIVINTNGTVLTNEHRRLLAQLPNVQFTLSVDGYYNLNNYIRYPSNWNVIIKNWNYLLESGHVVNINTTVSIYNIAELDPLLCYLDYIGHRYDTHLQTVEHQPLLDPLLYPDIDGALENLHQSTSTSVYRHSPLTASFIDGYIRKFLSIDTPNYDQLKKFFEFNDLLDSRRNLKLSQVNFKLDSYRLNLL